MNNQPPEKIVSREDGELDVHSIFYTIQGEGPFVGQPAIFVRLAGCNLQCPMCDTDYTSKRGFWTVDRLVADINDYNRAATLVVITGGEPFRQNLTPAVKAILEAGYRVQIETNGTLHLEGFPYRDVTLVISPKTGGLAPKLVQVFDNMTVLGSQKVHACDWDTFKYVARAGDIDADGLPTGALAHPAQPRLARPPDSFDGPVYLQPADEVGTADTTFDQIKKVWTAPRTIANNKNRQAVLKSCLQHGYTFGLQMHKIIGVE